MTIPAIKVLSHALLASAWAQLLAPQAEPKAAPKPTPSLVGITESRDAIEPGYYTVAISAEAEADPAWKAVADALVAKHGGERMVARVTFDAAKPESLIQPIRSAESRLLAVVLKPEQAGRAFVGGLHRAMRKLDEDPRSDLRWGMITARTAAGAMRLVTDTKPLVARHALGTADFPMGIFASAVWWSEESAWHFTMHEESEGESASPGTAKAERKTTSRTLDQDSIGKAVADAINTRQIDLVLTGGHATERGLELGFRKPAGRLGPKDGAIAITCIDGTVLDINNESPKAWIGVGNCLIGNVDGPDSAAAMLVEDFGVRAHVGYVVVTWFGRAGWGTLKWFTEKPGAHTLHAAWTYNNDAIIDELVRRWPQLAEMNIGDVTFEGWLENDPDRFAAAVRREAGDLVPEGELKDLTGLFWDRDAVSYIGDPTWDIRSGPQPSSEPITSMPTVPVGGGPTKSTLTPEPTGSPNRP